MSEIILKIKKCKVKHKTGNLGIALVKIRLENPEGSAAWETGPHMWLCSVLGQGKYQLTHLLTPLPVVAQGHRRQGGLLGDKAVHLVA